MISSSSAGCGVGRSLVRRQGGAITRLGETRYRMHTILSQLQLASPMIELMN